MAVLTTSPEDNELKEEGFWSTAQSNLMHSEGKRAFDYEQMSQLETVETLAHDIGKRLVSEADYDRLIEIETRITRSRKPEEQLRIMQTDLLKLREN